MNMKIEKFYVVIRNRCSISAEYIKSILHKAEYKLDRHYGEISGPYLTLDEAKERFNSILSSVDDDDYGIFAVDDSGQWWRILWGDLSEMIKI